MPDFTIAMQGKPTVELMDPMRVAAQGNAMAMQQMQMLGQQDERNMMAQKMRLAQNAAQQEFNEKDYLRLRDMVPAIAQAGPQAYAAWLSRVSEASPEMGAALNLAMPVGAFNPDKLIQMAMNVDQAINKKYSTPIASFFQDQQGALFGAQTGGTEPTSVQPGIVTPNPLEGAPAPAMQPPAAPAAPAQAFDREAVAKAAMQAKTITQEDADRVRASLGPNGGAAFDNWMQQQNIRIVPEANFQQQDYAAPQQSYFDRARWDSDTSQPTAFNAAAPEASFQQSAYQNAPGTQFVGAPKVPPSANVPLDRVAAAAGVEAAARRAPPAYEGEVASAKNSAEYVAELRKTRPKAKDAFNTSVSEINKQIQTVNQLLAHPGLDSIVGNVEGRLPRFMNAIRPGGQAADNAQSIYDTMVARAGFKALADMRAASPTGGALGNVSDTEGQFLRDSGATLGQVQDEEQFKAMLLNYKADLEASKARLGAAYKDTYAPVMPKDWTVQLDAARPPVKLGSPPKAPTNKRLRYNPATGELE